MKLTQTYTLTASPATQATEGTSVTITLTTFNVLDGAFPYTISGTGITAADFGLTSLTGSFNLVNSTASITLTLINDQDQSEVFEDFTISLNNGKANLIYRINDPLSQYSFTSIIPASVDEGSTVIFEITTVNVYFTTLYWDIDYNSSSSASDFPTPPNGSFPLSSNTGTFEVGPIINDLIKESTESFKVRVRTGSVTGPVVLTSNAININDTSTTVISTLTFEKSSYLIGQKAVLNWTITGAEYDTIQVSILKPDLTTLSVSGSLAKAIRTFSSSAVFNIEGEHIGRVALFKGTTKMAQNEIKTTVGSAPTFSLTRSAATGSENIPFTFTLTTTNMDEGVQVPFAITRNVTTALTTDFSSWVLNGSPIPPNLTGNFVVRSGGTNPDIATLVITPADDRITESSNETVTLTLGSPGSGSISYVIKDPNLTATAFSFTPVTGQEANTIVTSSNVTITGLEPNLSTTVTATGGSVDAGTTALSGSFAASQTLTSSPSGTILVAAQVTTGALGQVAKSVTITVNGKTNAAFTATTRLGDVDGDLSNPTNVLNAELNTLITIEAVFTNLEINASVTVTAASGTVSNNSSSGFGASCTLTTDSRGQASIWYRLTSPNAVSSTISMGTLTVKTSGATKTYAPNWSVTTKTADVTGTLNNPAALTNQNLNTVVTSAAATIVDLQKSYTFTLAITFGQISTSPTSGFAASISITSNASGTITFYYRVTTPTTFNTPISVGTLSLTAGDQISIYTTNWSATSRVFKILGTLTNPVNVTRSALNTVNKSAAATITGLETNYTYTLSAASGLISASATSGFATSISIASNASGAITFYYELTSPSEFGGSITMGQLTLTGNGETQAYTPTWSVTNKAIDVIGTLANPSSITTGVLNKTFTSDPATIIDLEKSYTFTLSAASGLISASATSGFATSISITSNASGAITFYYQLTASGIVAGKVTMGTLTLSGSGSNQTYTPTWSVTTRALDMNADYDFSGTGIVGTLLSDVPINTLYTFKASYRNLEPNYEFIISPANAEVSLDNQVWGRSVRVTTPANPALTKSFWIRLNSSKDYYTEAKTGVFTVTDPVTGNTFTDTESGDGFTFRTRKAKIGKITGTTIKDAPLSTEYAVTSTFSGYEPNYAFIITSEKTTTLISNDSISFSTSCPLLMDGSGNGTLYLKMRSSSSYESTVGTGLTVAYGDYVRDTNVSSGNVITTLPDPLSVGFGPPSDITTASPNVYYSANNALPYVTLGFVLSESNGFAGPAGVSYSITMEDGELSLSNGNWATTISLIAAGKAVSERVPVWWRKKSGPTPGATVSTGKITITHTDSGRTKVLTQTKWNITNIVSSKVSGTLSIPNRVYPASPNQEYTISTRLYGLTPSYPYTIEATAKFPYATSVEASRYDISADNENWAKSITWTTDSSGGNTIYYRLKAYPVSGTLSLFITVKSGIYSYTHSTAWSATTV